MRKPCFRQLVIQQISLDAERASGCRKITVMLAHGPRDEILKARRARRGDLPSSETAVPAQFESDVFRPDDIVLTEHASAVDDVLQRLSDVPRPVVCAQGCDGPRRNSDARIVTAPAITLGKQPARRGTSSRRSRSGGIVTDTTFRR